MPSSLSYRISKKLGRDPSEIETDLSTFFDTVRRQIESGAKKEFPGFGVFELAHGDIVFTPDASLTEVVNFRYRHLETVSIGAVTPSAIPPSDTADEISNEPAYHDTDQPPAGDSSETFADPSGPDPAEIHAGEVPDVSPPTEKTPGPRSVGIERAPVSSQKEFGKRTPSSPTPRPRSGGGLTRALFIGMPLLIIASIIVAVLYLDLTPGEPDGPMEEVIPAQVQTEQDDGATEQNIPQTDLSFEASTPNVQDVPVSVDESVNTPNEPEEAAQRAFASDFDESDTGYTLVVGSGITAEDAARALAPYAELGLPRAVVAYNDEGIIRYRMAVGQFDTIENAQLGLEQFGSRLPEGTWIRNIQLLSN